MTLGTVETGRGTGIGLEKTFVAGKAVGGTARAVSSCSAWNYKITNYLKLKVKNLIVRNVS